MARDPYIEQRLINWAKWCAGRGAGGLGYASTNWDAWDGSDRYGEGRAAVVQDDEQSITDQAVRSLERDLQEALAMQYIEGGAVAVKAHRLGVHEQTFRSRLRRGERGVSAWLVERQRAADLERERVESMQRAASTSLTKRVAVVAAERKRTDKILGVKRVRRVKRQ